MSERVQHRGGGRMLTKQSDALDTDINAIVGRYVAHGVMPVVNGRSPSYGDFSSGVTFHEALDRLTAAQDEFMALPAAVRDRCRNDPGEFLDLVLTPEGAAELAELGLPVERVPAKPAAVEEPVPVDPASGGGGDPTP